MPSFPKHIIRPPESARQLSQIAHDILRKGNALGILPTPIDDLIQAAKIKDESGTQNVIEKFLSSVPANLKSWFLSGIRKLRGIADLRDRAIYVPQDTAPRELFAKSHELGHELIPWHNAFPDNLNPYCKDDDLSLSPDAEKLFDQEANFFAAEIIFQGRLFRERVLSYQASFDAVFLLADQHGASRQATLRKYVEEQDEAVAAITYLPSRCVTDLEGLPLLRKPRLFGSKKFSNKFANILAPQIIQSTHPWAEARRSRQVCEGDIDLYCGPDKIRFSYEVWWNTYNLLVFLRHEPAITRIRKNLYLRVDRG